MLRPLSLWVQLNVFLNPLHNKRVPFLCCCDIISQCISDPSTAKCVYSTAGDWRTREVTFSSEIRRPLTLGNTHNNPLTEAIWTQRALEASEESTVHPASTQPHSNNRHSKRLNWVENLTLRGLIWSTNRSTQSILHVYLSNQFHLLSIEIFTIRFIFILTMYYPENLEQKTSNSTKRFFFIYFECSRRTKI